MNLKWPSKDFFKKAQRGISMIEQILVLLIITISASLAYNKMAAGADNKEAKAVIMTEKQIANGVKMYQLNLGSLPTQTDLSDLETNGYVKRQEFSVKNKYVYTFVPNAGIPSEWKIEATNGTRTLTVKNKTDHFEVTDSAGLYDR